MMTTVDPLNRARDILCTHVEQVDSLTQLNTASGNVVRARGMSGTDYVIKFRAGQNSAGGASPESSAYRLLADEPAARHCYASGQDFLVLEHLSGSALGDQLDAGTLEYDKVAKALTAFLRTCATADVHGYGVPVSEFRAPYDSWTNFLRDKVTQMEKRAQALSADAGKQLRGSLDALRRTLAEPQDLFDGVRPALTPVTLDFANVLVDEDGKVTVLDLDELWIADPLFAIGQLAAQAYGTPVYPQLLSAWSDTEDVAFAADKWRRVRFYALLATVEFQLRTGESGGDPVEARPRGNQWSFSELATAHHFQLVNANSAQPEQLCARVPEFAAGWHGKYPNGMRAEPASTAFERLNRVKMHAGITRVADVTALDRTGIYVCQSVRPDADIAQDTFTVFSGRGMTPEQSKVAAIAEGIERFCGERDQFEPGRVQAATYGELAERANVVGPERFNLPDDAEYDADTRMEWVPATEIVTGESWWVPACTVFYPYSPTEDTSAPMRYFTTGFGAANSAVEAIAHGLAEVAERDAAALNRILRSNPAVRLDSVHASAARSQLDRLIEAELNTIVRCISAPDIGIPVYSAICEDDMPQDTLYISGGYGAHPDKDVAVLRAVQEAAASRAGTISGSREDLTKFKNRGSDDYERFRKKYAYWFDTSRSVDYRELPSSRLPTVLDDLSFMVDAFTSAGFPQILAVDLTRPEFGLRVFKVLVPGVERYSFKMRCVGERARRMYREQFGRDLRVPPIHPGVGTERVSA